MSETKRFTFDTNILIYSVDESNRAKHETSRLLVFTLLDLHAKLPLQAVTEFFNATQKKKLASVETAQEFVLSFLSAAETVSAIDADVASAIDLHREHNIPFFDALLLATAARSGCTTLFSEDFQHDRTYGTLTVRNPFKLSEAGLTTLLT
jgi:predicted nucleic acid-binding protein